MAVLVVAPAWQHAAESPKPSHAGAPMLTAVKSDDQTWGIVLVEAGLAGASQPRPVELEFWSPDATLSRVESGYQRIMSGADGLTGEAEIAGPENARFAVRDRWRAQGQVVRLSRSVTLAGGAAGGSCPASGWISGNQRPGPMPSGSCRG
jgi:hypothetical protein